MSISPNHALRDAEQSEAKSRQALVGVAAQQLSAALSFKVNTTRLALLWLCADDALPAGELLGEQSYESWRALFTTAEQESLHTALTARISADAAGCPADILNAAKQRASVRRKWNRYLALAAVDVVNRLQAASVRACVLKGAPLSLLTYGEADVRDTRDIDILVSETDLPAAAAALEQAGFACSLDARWLRHQPLLQATREISFHKLGGAFEIDLHWRLSNRWIRSEVDDETLLARANQPMEMFGHQLQWFASPDMLRVARANIANSQRVELRAVIDWMRCQHLAMGTVTGSLPPATHGVQGHAVRTGLSADIAARTQEVLGSIGVVSLLGTATAARDLLEQQASKQQLGAAAHWMRHFRRIRSARQAVTLAGTALMPTVNDYAASKTGAEAVTRSIVRKVFRATK